MFPRLYDAGSPRPRRPHSARRRREGVPLFTGLARPLNLRLITLDTPGLPLSTRLTVASLSPALSQSTQP
jgi:hypothetical protein